MSNCKAKKPCGCEDTGLTTPSPCIHDTPECPDPPQCCEIFDSACIQYNGLGNTCLKEITTGQTVQEVLDILMTELAALKCVSCPVISIPNSGTTDVSLLPTLIWAASPGATMYDVYFGTDPLALAPISIGQAGTSYTFVAPNDLTVGTVYYWSVTARSNTASSGACSPFSFTTVGSVCKNPITTLFDAVRKIVETQEKSYGVALEDILTSGYMLNSCDTCCPDCEETKRYFLGNITQWVTYSDTVYNANTCPPPCCVNKALNISNLITFTTNNNVIGTPPGGCCDDFSKCFTDLVNYVGTGELIEESSFKDTSGICTMMDWFTSQTEPFRVQDAQEMMLSLVTYGLVIQCLPDGNIIVAGVDAYINWYIATNQTCYSQIQ